MRQTIAGIGVDFNRRPVRPRADSGPDRLNSPNLQVFITTRAGASRYAGPVQTLSHVLNWQAGWALVLGAFLTGALMGLAFHRQDFLGGYGSFRRRLVRLGHIALAALGMLNVLFSLSPLPAPGTWQGRAASLGFVIGGVMMPLVCFLAAWREPFRHVFAIPVIALVLAVVFTLAGGVQ
jgi:hypothetical protein